MAAPVQRRSFARQPSIIGHDQQRRHRPDYILLIIGVFLLVFGLIVVYSISPGLAAQTEGMSDNYYAGKQLIAILLGIAAFAIVAVTPYQKWRKLQAPLIIAAIAAALVVRLFAEPVHGAYRWIQIGGISFQAVELIKFALLVWLAGFLANRIARGNLDDPKGTFKPILIALAVIGAVVAVVQSDLGSTGVLAVMLIAMCFVAGMPLKRFVVLGGVVVVGTFLAISMSSYRTDRVMTYLQPERDCQNAGYQACQALIAVGSGGMFGRGLAHSVQAYGYLPEAANDSIFAIIAEKFGFIGVTALISLFVGLFARLIKIIERAPDEFSRLLVVGILAWLSTQMMINVGAMVGLIPLKGITLPFISYGGTSIIFVSAAVGVAFSISRYTSYTINLDNVASRKDKHESIAYRGRDRRPYHATVSRRP
ncbi:stage V sporulation protein E [soil metagenome]